MTTQAHDVVVVGAGISGLTLGICLHRVGIDVLLVDKVKQMKDAGSGMSVIGHSLSILRNLGIDLPSTIGLKQTDVSLRAHTGQRLFQVPLHADPELVREFGSVQYNVHRGELQQALMDVYLREGGRLLTGKRFVSLTQTETACPPQSPRASSSSAPTRLSRAAVTATFEDGTTVAAQLLVGADGARSRVRACLYGEECLRYSGASCWRGFIPECPSALRATDAAQRQCMYKTVSHPNGFGASFTCGWTTRQRCFWVLDVNYPKDTPFDSEEKAMAFLLEQTRSFAPEVQTIIRSTKAEALIQTDVYDCKAIPCRLGGVVLVGDAGHAVVHHFGQGACLAIEDAVALAASIHRHAHNGVVSNGTVHGALEEFDSWSRWFRTRALVLISRWCGMVYMNNHPATNAVLTLCLAWPLNLVFIAVMRLLLFFCDRPLRQLSSSLFAPKS